jgi:hypothetical protein
MTVPKLDNVLLPLGFEPQTLNPVASRSTDYAILAAQYTRSFRSHYGPGIDSASNRNEYQERFLGVKATGA